MRPLLALLARDARLMVRNRFLHVGLVVAALLGGLVRGVLPAELEGQRTWVSQSPGLGLLERAPAGALPPEHRLADAEAVREAVALHPEDAGLALVGTPDGWSVRLTLAQQAGPATQAVQETAAWALAMHLDGQDPRPRVQRLRAAQPPLPFNHSLLPLLITADALFLGFLFGSVMVLQERTERTLHAYRVSPGGALRWVLSKTLVNAGASTLYAAVVLGLSGVAAVRWGLALGVVAVGSAALTLGGMALAVFFRSLMDMLYPLLLVNLVLLLPLGASFLPGTGGAWLMALPTWPALMGLREALTPGGHSPPWGALAAGLLPWVLGLGVLCTALVRQRLMKEAT